MNNRHITDLAAAVRQRLHDLIRQCQEDFDLVLGRFASERLEIYWPAARFWENTVQTHIESRPLSCYTLSDLFILHSRL